jgi:hypothetical protein
MRTENCLHRAVATTVTRSSPLASATRVAMNGL